MIDIGKAYVQIIPSAQGVGASISRELSGELPQIGDSAGQSIGRRIVSSLKKVVVGAGIGKAITESIKQAGDLEQSIGGVETLFKDSADKVIANADVAFKTVGVSANEYMENVTSFSASLLQSLGGDTNKAAEIANIAMIDMGDNANKMGTAMQDIQNAYQGFAKQNYTMLDNLKLGYGGTKSEMERLLADAQALSGVEYNIDNLSDVYEAIHVIQQELGITGTTALEASETLSGSFGAMKSAFVDFIGQIALGNDTLGSTVMNLGETIMTFLNNLIPMVIETVTMLPLGIANLIEQYGGQITQQLVDLVSGLGEKFKFLLPNIITSLTTGITQIVTTLVENIPAFIEAGLNLIEGLADGIMQAIPIVIESAPKIITGLVTAFLESIPKIIDTGTKLLTSLVDNLPEIISMIVDAIPQIITGIINAFVENAPKIAEAGVKLITALITNLPEILTTIVGAIPDIVRGIVDAFKEGIPQLVDVGKNLVKGLWEGIKSLAGWLTDKVTGWVSGLWGGIKSFFGIESPSRKMAYIGEMMSEGMAVGIEDNLSSVDSAMNSLEETATRELHGSYNFGINSQNGQLQSSLNTSFGTQASSSPAETNALLRELISIVSASDFGGDVLIDGTALVGHIAPKMDEALTEKRIADDFGGGRLAMV